MLVEISLTLCNSVICYRFICVNIFTLETHLKSHKTDLGVLKHYFLVRNISPLVGPHLSYTGNKNCIT